MASSRAPARSNRGEVRPARDHRYVVPSAREAHGHEPANGAGANDTDLHRFSICRARTAVPEARQGQRTSIEGSVQRGTLTADSRRRTQPPNSVTLKTRAMITIAVNPVNTAKLNQANPRVAGDG